MGRGRGHQGLLLKCLLGESTDKGSDSYHICSLILLPSSSIVLILKSIPEKKKKERKGHISVSPISQAMSEEGAVNMCRLQLPWFMEHLAGTGHVGSWNPHNKSRVTGRTFSSHGRES